MLQKIKLNSFQIPVSIGVHEWEKKQLQTLSFDLVLWVDVALAMKTDQLSHTIDYTEIASSIKTISSQKHYHLIEHLAFQILESFSNKAFLFRCSLCITKPNVFKNLESVSFETDKIYREYSEI